MIRLCGFREAQSTKTSETMIMLSMTLVRRSRSTQRARSLSSIWLLQSSRLVRQMQRQKTSKLVRSLRLLELPLQNKRQSMLPHRGRLSKRTLPSTTVQAAVTTQRETIIKRLPISTKLSRCNQPTQNSSRTAPVATLRWASTKPASMTCRELQRSTAEIHKFSTSKAWHTTHSVSIRSVSQR